MRYHLMSFGCQMNEHDSERMKGVLEEIGYNEVTEQDDADLILFNTCTIRGSADERFLGNLGHAKRIKRERPRHTRGGRGLLGPSPKRGGLRPIPFCGHRLRTG